MSTDSPPFSDALVPRTPFGYRWVHIGHIARDFAARDGSRTFARRLAGTRVKNFTESKATIVQIAAAATKEREVGVRGSRSRRPEPVRTRRLCQVFMQVRVSTVARNGQTNARNRVSSGRNTRWCAGAVRLRARQRRWGWRAPVVVDECYVLHLPGGF